MRVEQWVRVGSGLTGAGASWLEVVCLYREKRRPDGTYILNASKKEAGSAQSSAIRLEDGAAVTDLKLVLQNSETGTVVCVALDLKRGKPLAKGWCRLAGDKGEFAHTAQRGADGVLTIPNVPAGDYRAIISAYGYSVGEHQGRVVAGKETFIGRARPTDTHTRDAANPWSHH